MPPSPQPKPVKYETSNGQETELSRLPTGVQQMIWATTWLPKGEGMLIGITPGDETGLTMQEINSVEQLTGRFTTDPTASIPLRLTIRRDEGGAGGIMQLTRYSATTGNNTEILAVAANYDGPARYRAISANSPQITGPILEKLATTLPSRAAKALLDKRKPNFLLIPHIFSTSDPMIKWLQMRSPASEMPSEGHDSPHRRLYMNLLFPDPALYQQFLDRLQTACRAYPEPLNYKFLFSGDPTKLSAELAAPEATKAVFYFHDMFKNGKDGKEAARRFAQYLIARHVMDGFQRGNQHISAVPSRGGELFANGGIVLAKGTKEERADIVRGVGFGDLTRMIRGQMLSV